MSLHDPYIAKALEYLVGLVFLACFVGFWQFVNGGGTVSSERARAWSGQLSEFFRVPADVFFHPGHAWARWEGHGVMTLGLDDFAQQLVGPISAIDLPPVGTALNAGSRAWSITVDARSVDMLAPVTGTVIAVNGALNGRPGLANDDPYGGGWLAKVRVPRASKAPRGMMTGRAARAWMDRVSSDLTAAFTPELGLVSQDGGVPILGFARGISEKHWDDVARTFLLS
jgi:glycine cleavage system H protein